MPAIAAALVVASCGDGKKGTSASAGNGNYAIEETFERGPVKVVLRIDNDEPTIADRIHLELEVTSQEDYEVDLPSFGDKLEQFGIVDYSTSQPTLVGDNRTRQLRSYVLEPFLSGEYVIPPMKFAFRKKGEAAADADGDGEEKKDHELETEEVKLKVRSLLAEDRSELKIHEIVPPVELPAPSLAWLWWTVGGALAGLVALMVFVRWLVRKRNPEAFQLPPRPAHEIAFDQLRDLVAEDLPEKGAIKLFYQRISDILRHYIENRFGLHAPEQTTEEFLVSLSASASLNRAHRPLLKTFLEHCDLVKFADHHPSSEDIQRTFDACKNFIAETRAAEASAASTVTSGDDPPAATVASPA